MPRYELMYILASAVSDDQLPEVSANITKVVADFGGTELEETQLGKKKLMYPVKKTRNGFYNVIQFTMDTTKINELDAKIRTMDGTIIRYIIVNMDEHIARMARDLEVQTKMNRNRPPQEIAAEAEGMERPTAPVQPKAENITEADLDLKIEKALTEDVV